MFDTYPAPLRMSRVTDRNGNWLNSDSYCIFHMACLHELGALRLQTAAPEYAAAPRDRRERLFVSLFTQHFSMRHNKLCDNKKKKERKQSKSAKRLNKRHVRTGTAGRGRPQIWSRERVCSKRSGATSREPQTNKQTNKRPQWPVADQKRRITRISTWILVLMRSSVFIVDRSVD